MYGKLVRAGAAALILLLGAAGTARADFWVIEFDGTNSVAKKFDNAGAYLLTATTIPQAGSLHATKDGGAWIYDRVAKALVRVDAAGGETVRLASFNIDGYSAIDIFPPDGSVFVVRDRSALYRLDGVTGAVIAGPVALTPAIAGQAKVGIVAVDPVMGDAWVSDFGGRIDKYDASGGLVATVTALTTPFYMAVDPADGSVWVGARGPSGEGALYKLASDGSIQFGPYEGLGASIPRVTVDPRDSTLWNTGRVGSAQAGFIEKRDPIGLVTVPSIPSGALATSVGVDLSDGSVWITETETMNPSTASIVHRASDGAELVRFGGYVSLSFLSVVPPNTRIGRRVRLDLGYGVVVTFNEVWTAGSTTMTVSQTGPDAGDLFLPLPGGLYYDISTTCTFVGSVQIQITYSDAGLTKVQEEALRLYHFTDGAVVDVTNPSGPPGPPNPQITTNLITGTTPGFSPFVIGLPIIPLALRVHPREIEAGSKGVFSVSATPPDGVPARSFDPAAFTINGVAPARVKIHGAHVAVFARRADLGLEPGVLPLVLDGRTTDGLPARGRTSVLVRAHGDHGDGCGEDDDDGPDDDRGDRNGRHDDDDRNGDGDLR